MQGRRLYLLSAILLISEIDFGITGQGVASDAAPSAAKAAEARHVGDDDRARDLLKQTADAMWLHRRLMTAALASLVVAIGAWGLSVHRGEKGRARVLVLLTACAVIVQLILVQRA